MYITVAPPEGISKGGKQPNKQQSAAYKSRKTIVEGTADYMYGNILPWPSSTSPHRYCRPLFKA